MATESREGLWERLLNLPAVAALKKGYEKLTADYPLLNTASVQVTKAAEKVVQVFPGAADSLDSLACSALTRLEEKAPIIKKTPDELYKTIQGTTEAALGWTFSTAAGHLVLTGLETALGVSDAALKKISPEDTTKEETVVSTENAGEQQKTDDKDQKPRNVVTIVKTLPTTGLHLLYWIRRKIFRILHHPLSTWVSILKWLVKTGHEARQKVPKKGVQTRRTVSPRRRKPSSLTRKVWNALSGLLGVGKRFLPRLPGFSEEQKKGSKKRKQWEESESEGEEGVEVLLKPDLDNYQSDEDPDFVADPDAHQSDDSLEYDSGEDKEEIETEIQPVTPGKEPVSSKLQVKDEDTKVPPAGYDPVGSDVATDSGLDTPTTGLKSPDDTDSEVTPADITPPTMSGQDLAEGEETEPADDSAQDETEAEVSPADNGHPSTETTDPGLEKSATDKETAADTKLPADDDVPDATVADETNGTSVDNPKATVKGVRITEEPWENIDDQHEVAMNGR